MRRLESKVVPKDPTYQFSFEMTHAEYKELLREFDRHHEHSQSPLPVTTAVVVKQILEAITHASTRT